MNKYVYSFSTSLDCLLGVMRTTNNLADLEGSERLLHAMLGVSTTSRASADRLLAFGATNGSTVVAMTMPSQVVGQVGVSPRWDGVAMLRLLRSKIGEAEDKYVVVAHV
jgi:hypothetical protein